MESSDDHIDLVPLTSGQAEQFARIEELWPEFGHSLQVIAATNGGMAWRTVDGVEYLTRYTQVDGKKQGRSLGRRSPETEAQMEHFDRTVLKARRIRREKREDVLLTCKLAKAHGVARLHGKFADALDWLWYTDAGKRVALFGGSALLGYESASDILTPADLIKDDHLQFIAKSDDPATMGIEEIGEACGVQPGEGSVDIEKGRYVVRLDDRIVAEIFPPSFFVRHLEHDPAETMAGGFEIPRLRSLTFSRDSRPIEIRTLDPRVYAMAASVLRDDGVWTRRAGFAAEMVRRRWSDGFDERQEAVLDDPFHPKWPGPGRI